MKTIKLRIIDRCIWIVIRLIDLGRYRTAKLTKMVIPTANRAWLVDYIPLDIYSRSIMLRTYGFGSYTDAKHAASKRKWGGD